MIHNWKTSRQRVDEGWCSVSQSEVEKEENTGRPRAEIHFFLHLSASSWRVVLVSERKDACSFYDCFPVPEGFRVLVFEPLRVSILHSVLASAHPLTCWTLIHSADKPEHPQIYFLRSLLKWGWFKHTFHYWLSPFGAMSVRAGTQKVA